MRSKDGGKGELKVKKGQERKEGKVMERIGL